MNTRVFWGIGISTVSLYAGLLFGTVVMKACNGIEPHQSQTQPDVLAVERALRSAKTGDLIVDAKGRVSLFAENFWLTPHPDLIMKSDMVYIGDSPMVLSARYNINIVAKETVRVVSKSDGDYGSLANCFFRGKLVDVEGPGRFTCR